MASSGKVILVGAGPGDPGLLTLRGKQALESADVVLYDRLVGDAVLALIPPSALGVDVGKSSGRHLLPQEEINSLILTHAKNGKQVVRLKGGDPYLFGRGAEELEAVAALGIPFEVVSGVTSALAVPALAGIPVSHRDYASSVHIITGHARHGAEPSIHYPSLVKLGGTLVFLMGVGAIRALTHGLLAAGMSPSTPAALIENGARPEQRKLLCPLADIADRARAEGFAPPSVLVVGQVCGLSASLDWQAMLPLKGVSVVVTRPRQAAGALSSRLRQLGCTVVDFPCIRTRPLALAPDVFTGLNRYDWVVLTSPVGADLFFDGLAANHLDARALAGLRVAVVGAKTGEAVSRRGIRPDLMPERYSGKDLANALCAQGQPGQRVLLFRAKGASSLLPASLKQYGFVPEDIAAYETLHQAPDNSSVGEAVAQNKVKYAAFTSASTVHGFASALSGLDFDRLTAVCIGEETAAAAKTYGFRVLVSAQATMDSLVERILQEEGAQL